MIRVQDVRGKDNNSQTFYGAQYRALHHFLGECNGWDIVMLKSGHYYPQIIPIVSCLKVLRLDHSKQGFWHSGLLPVKT
jgi:hypothetical protein